MAKRILFVLAIVLMFALTACEHVNFSDTSGVTPVPQKQVSEDLENKTSDIEVPNIDLQNGDAKEPCMESEGEDPDDIPPEPSFTDEQKSSANDTPNHNKRVNLPKMHF